MPVISFLSTTHFDHGAISQLQKSLDRNNIKRPLIATDKGIVAAGILDTVTGAINEGAAAPVFDDTPGNPTERAVMAALAVYEAEGCDGVIALGGGSAMDLGKTVALLAGSGGPLSQFDPLQGGNKLVKKMAPVIAVPTTSGTGSEVSLGMVIIMEDGRKLTFGNPKFVPTVAICDPELTLGLPPLLTAATGMDAITHCIEAFLTPTINPPADGVGLDGLWRGWRNLAKAVKDGSDKDARWEMMMASTEGAHAFTMGLGAVHAMSHAIGRREDLRLHHGTLNAVILPAVLRFNEPGCEDKYDRLRSTMGLTAGADLAVAIEELNADIGLPSGLGAMGVSEDMIEDFVPHALADLAHRTNPREASAEDYAALFRQAM
ncbi:iron-containing alcohol dehydrogenase [Anderseniella sp. Alg231-50]|uniref:iron-containing alcohol dehydrogenase n=1 Tax=Anderseniella sp. Alg231-50 TaxID=1922226 RepID=UPI000D5526EC